MKKHFQRAFSLLACLSIIISAVAFPFTAHTASIWDMNSVSGTVADWFAGWFGQNTGLWNPVDPLAGLYTANKPQKYYTTPTSSVEDKYGNVTNYYRGGDTTNTQIIDSYNRTFNTIHNTTNNTNNYSANVKLSDFLNTYSTVNNDYTYNTRFNSWYYDNTSNTFNYDASQTYYNTDNSQYYISIDNSTDEYYLINVQYSPTFVTVNYTYNNIDNSTHYGDVTNVYYFELTDGRNSSTLSASEVAGLDLGYDVTNYVLVPDDPDTLSLQHFDGNYTDSSAYGRAFHSVNRSVNYVDSGAFGKAVQLGATSEAGVVIPDLASLDRFSIEFRAYHNLSYNFNTTPAPFQLFVGGLNLHETLTYGTYSYNIYYPLSLSDWYSDEHNNSCTFCSYYVVGKGYSKSTTGYKQWGDTYTRVYSSSSVTDDTLYNTWQKVVSNAPLTQLKCVYGCFLDTSAVTFQSGTYEFKDYSCRPDTATQTVNLSYNGAHMRSGIRANDAEYLQFTDFGARSQWNTFKFVFTPGKIEQYTNGDLVYSYDIDWSSAVTGNSIYIKPGGTLYLDELRVCGGSLVTSAQYNPATAPYDTNMVLALPDDLVANTIYVRHEIPVNGFRIGGVRPSNPTTGFFYLPLHEDYTGGQPQLYDGSNWVNVIAMVYDGTSTKDVIGFKFTPIGTSEDVDTDLEPGRPTKPGEAVDPDTCSHDWQEESSIKPSCVMAGSVTLKCSKCQSTKTETIPKLSHVWEVKQSVQTAYDEEGNILTLGYTIYRCTVCNEEYKDTDGIGPPGGSDSSTDDEEGGGFLSWLGGKLGELFGSIGNGIISLLQAALGKVLDGLINLVNMTFEKLSQLVDLFGSFGDALGVLWTWLPSEVMTVLIAAVTVFVFVALIKLFMK